MVAAKLWRRETSAHTSWGRVLASASLAAETDKSRGEKSRLKAGGSQDWLPHKNAFT
jgi:hypothetical protein